MQISIRHQISVAIGEDAPRAMQHLLLTPQASSVQTIKEWRIEVPGMDAPDGFIDAYGNRAHMASQTKPDAEITITASGIVETHDLAGVVGRLDRDPVPALFRRTTDLAKPIDGMADIHREAAKDGMARIALLHELMEQVAESVRGSAQRQSQSQSQGGQSQSQGVAMPAEAADYTHAFIGVARALNIPARFVSGYLVPEDDEPATFHAWAEAWDDGLGWIGFDVMLELCPTERHVRLATGLDAISAVPVRSVPVVGTPSLIGVQIEIAQ